MDEERPVTEAREAMDQRDAIDQEVEFDSTTGSETAVGSGDIRRGNKFIIPGVILVVVLIIASLFLPPFSLGRYLGFGGGEAAEVEVADTLAIPGEIRLVVKDTTGRAGVRAIAQDAFLSNTAGEEWHSATSALPDDLTLRSSVYAIDFPAGSAPTGQVILTAAGNDTQWDVYRWDGSAWRFVPGRYERDQGQFVTDETTLAPAYVMAEVAPQTAVVSSELLPAHELPESLLPVLDELVVGTLTLNDGGGLAGSATAGTGQQRHLLRATNTGVIIDQVSLSGLLGNQDAQGPHIQKLVDEAKSGGFNGVNLDYQGVAESQRNNFTAFVGDLAGALQVEGLSLVVTLAPPVRSSNGDWVTGGQDWAAVGQLADGIYVQMPLDPAAYDDGGPAHQQLAFATARIDRRKLTMLVTANAVDMIGEVYYEVPFEVALDSFGDIDLLTLEPPAEGEAVLPGTAVEVGLDGGASPLLWDTASMAYKYTYGDGDQMHTVWLSNEAALSHRLRLAGTHNLNGVAIRGLSGVPDALGAGYVKAIESFLTQAETPQPSAAAIVWLVEDESGGVIASNAGEALTFQWQAADVPGSYTINAGLAQGENVSNLGALTLAVAQPEPTPSPEPTEEPVVEEEPTAAPTGAPVAPIAVGDADAVVNSVANVRVGPGLTYKTIAGGLQTGAKVTLIGRNSASTWLNIRFPDGQTEGWIFATLLTVNPGLSVAALPVIEVEPPVVEGGGGAPPPPIANSGFELGGQTHSLANPQLMAYSGMRWVKFQHKWGSGDNGADLAGRINQAHANGFKVLLSIPGANVYPNSIDFNGYVTFLGQVAAQGPDAIEVWNEMNIDFEWPAGQIDPASYVNNMLAPAYAAIKAANPNVMVISGAPAPTGFDNGHNAWSDQRYMNGMGAAGGANYMDCVGVHYNEGILPPSQQSGDPRVPSDYYTRYFWGMVNTYWNAFGGSRPLCFTELGYLSGDGYPGLPGNFSWAANTTVAKHAAWLAEAASLSSSSGKVRMMIIFNVDFTYYDPNGDPQAGYAMIRPDGSCPACETLHQVTGGR